VEVEAVEVVAVEEEATLTQEDTLMAIQDMEVLALLPRQLEYPPSLKSLRQSRHLARASMDLLSCQAQLAMVVVMVVVMVVGLSEVNHLC
jgi:hypothetical protein